MFVKVKNRYVNLNNITSFGYDDMKLTNNNEMGISKGDYEKLVEVVQTQDKLEDELQEAKNYIARIEDSLSKAADKIKRLEEKQTPTCAQCKGQGTVYLGHDRGSMVCDACDGKGY